MKKQYLALIVFVLGCLPFVQGQDQPYFTGLEFNQDAYEELAAVPPLLTREYSATPSSFSLKEYAPIPKNQGQQGSCVGWSTTYAARTILESIYNAELDKYNITSNAFSPSFAYNQAQLGSSCDRGSYISSVLKILQEQGAPRLKDFPYECNRAITQTDRIKASQHKIKEYRRLYSSSQDVIQLVKKSISEKKPVVIGMACYKSFYSASGVWSGVQDEFLGGHAMAIIGYDDTKYGGAVEIMNSWGTDWGNDGFIWVKYSDLKDNCREFYEVLGEEPPTPVVVEEKETVDLSGSMRLVKDDGTEIGTKIATNANRDFNIVSAGNSTYRTVNSVSSGTQFRVYISNNQPAYVYLLGYSGTSQKVQPLYPFGNYSAYLNYKSNSVAFPNEDYYIRMDENKGKDYLIILYSKEKLDINSIAKDMENNFGHVSIKVKRALEGKIVEGSNITFGKRNISFEAVSKGKSIVPIILEVDHI